MSKKDIIKYIYSGENSCSKQKKLFEFKRINTSHYGIVVLDPEGNQVLRSIFQSENNSIFNNSKEEEVSGQSDHEVVYEDWRKLPRGWFSTSRYHQASLCIRHATSKEYQDGKWNIITSPVEEDLIFRVHLFANTIQDRELLHDLTVYSQTPQTKAVRSIIDSRTSSSENKLNVKGS